MTKTATIPRFFVFLLSVLLLLDPAGASDHSCACEAEKLGFEIDCANTQAMLDALEFLEANACATDCSSPACEKNYYIVQAHHDFCPQETIPEELEDGFHDFDQSCVECDIMPRGLDVTSAATADAMECPKIECGDGTGNDAYTALVENGCNIACGSEICRDLYLVLRVVHDTCDHGVLSPAAEEGLHDLERPCAEHVCFFPDQEGVDPLECVPEEDPHAGHDHDHGSHDHSSSDHGSSDDSGAAVSVRHNTVPVAVLAVMAMVVV